MRKNNSEQGKIKTWVTTLVVLLLVAIALLLLNLNMKFGAGEGKGGENEQNSSQPTAGLEAAAAINTGSPSNVIQFCVTDLDQIYVREQPCNRREFKNIKENADKIGWKEVDGLLAKAKRKKWLVEIVIFEKNASREMKEQFEKKEDKYKESGAGTFIWVKK